MIDGVAALTLCPEGGRAFQGQPGLVLSAADGTPLLPAFQFSHAETTPNHLRLISRAGGLTLTHDICASASGILTLQTDLTCDHANPYPMARRPGLTCAPTCRTK